MAEIVMRARWAYDSSQLEKLKSDVDTAKEKIKASSAEMEVSYKSLAVNISHLATAGLALQGTWERVAEGQMSVAEGAVRSIPALVSLASSIWVVVGAENARAIAHAIANALSGPVGWAILAGAVAAAATGIALASRIPSHHYEGVIQETGPYIMAKGQYVSTPGASSSGTTIHIHNLTVQTSSPRDFVDKMRRLGVS